MLSESEIAAIEQKALGALRARLGIKSRSLAHAMKRAGRRLPREAHRAAAVLSTAKAQINHPKLSRLIDPTSVQAADQSLHGYLEKIDPGKIRTDRILSMLGTQVFNLLVIAGAFVTYLVWRGYL